MGTQHLIVNGDSRDMSNIKAAKVHLIVTSPPYWQIKDYGNQKQIGYNSSYEKYINDLNLVWLECQRLLHPGCRLCINIGDQYTRASHYGRYKVIPIRTEIIKFCEAIGLDYMGAVIWQKTSTMNTSGGATIMGSFPYPRNGILKLDYEFILIFKKQGDAPKVAKAKKQLSSLSTEEWNKYFTGHWNFGGVRQEGHLAMFPEELPKRLIKMFSFYGDTVLDPFLGSGTTSLAARNLGRNSIGYEIAIDFIKLIKEKLEVTKLDFEKTRCFFRKSSLQKISSKTYAEKVKALKYSFTDFNAIQLKIDPKQHSYGSKISKRLRK